MGINSGYKSLLGYLDKKVIAPIKNTVDQVKQKLGINSGYKDWLYSFDKEVIDPIKNKVTNLLKPPKLHSDLYGSKQGWNIPFTDTICGVYKKDGMKYLVSRDANSPQKDIESFLADKMLGGKTDLLRHQGKAYLVTPYKEDVLKSNSKEKNITLDFIKALKKKDYFKARKIEPALLEELRKFPARKPYIDIACEKIKDNFNPDEINKFNNLFPKSKDLYGIEAFKFNTMQYCQDVITQLDLVHFSQPSEVVSKKTMEQMIEENPNYFTKLKYNQKYLEPNQKIDLQIHPDHQEDLKKGNIEAIEAIKEIREIAAKKAKVMEEIGKAEEMKQFQGLVGQSPKHVAATSRPKQGIVEQGR